VNQDKSRKIEEQSKGPAARAALLWGGLFTLVRDVLQFVTMLVLVRMLSPADYGAFALAQTFLGLLSVVSFNVFITHALQVRNPSEIDWQAHFTASVAINGVLAIITLLVSWSISYSPIYAEAVLPLAVLSLVFLVEIPGSMRHRMVQVTHDWKRFRLILVAGGLLGSSAGITIALLGGGIWALVVQPILLGLPAAIDLLLIEKWRPDWTWSWPRYRDTAHFGVNRIGSGAVQRGSKVVEQSILTSTYDFTGLGMFTRAIGLATLIAGRIGAIALDSLYPVITRAEVRSDQFKRYSSLVLRGVAWVIVPAAGVLALTAEDLVNTVYGPQWTEVIPLMPFAAAVAGLGGLTIAASNLLLANNEARAQLVLDTVSSFIVVICAFVFIPIGMQQYLAALVFHGLTIFALSTGILISKQGMTFSAAVSALFPAIMACGAAVMAVIAARSQLGVSDVLILRLALDALLFGGVYIAILRLVFSDLLAEILNVVPFGSRMCRLLRL
jgi:O-antigen/teichoic acid export membrane protein